MQLNSIECIKTAASLGFRDAFISSLVKKIPIEHH